MNDDRHLGASWLADIERLADVLLTDEISSADRARLEQLVCENPAARRAYVRYIYDSLNLFDLAGQPLISALENDAPHWPQKEPTAAGLSPRSADSVVGISDHLTDNNPTSPTDAPINLGLAPVIDLHAEPAVTPASGPRPRLLIESQSSATRLHGHSSTTVSRS